MKRDRKWMSHDKWVRRQITHPHVIADPAEEMGCDLDPHDGETIVLMTFPKVPPPPSWRRHKLNPVPTWKSSDLYDICTNYNIYTFAPLSATLVLLQIRDRIQSCVWWESAMNTNKHRAGFAAQQKASCMRCHFIGTLANTCMVVTENVVSRSSTTDWKYHDGGSIRECHNRVKREMYWISRVSHDTRNIIKVTQHRTCTNNTRPSKSACEGETLPNWGHSRGYFKANWE